MLIDFSLTNYRSFKDKQTLSMVRDKGDEHIENTFVIDKSKKFSLLKSAAIYGANASGKSNFLNALRAMKNIVTEQSQHGDKLPLVPFKLNNKNITQPTEFEVTFMVDGIRYQYGFTASNVQIFDEWLFAFPKNHAQKWFERIWDYESQNYEWKFSSFLLGTKQIWLQSTRNNALFLSTAVQLNSKQLKPVFDWFDKTLKLTGIAGFNPEYTVSVCQNDNKKEIINFLKAADFCIHDINVKREEFQPLELLPSGMPDDIKEIFKKELQGKKILIPETVHLDNHGNPINFELSEESDGTQKFFELSGPILDVLKNGYVLCIDELNIHLHPKLVSFIANLFHSEVTNPENAQLIFTTHETSILDQDIFRRDQIWFCKRDKNQASTLYPLSDFQPKKGKENIEKGYLSGRYGALPFISSFKGID